MIDDIAVRIVLIDTFHPGNIGAVARAMKTMGLERLFLVRPRCFPDEDASSRATGAKDVLDKASVCQSLEEAIADCVFVVGTSARGRRVKLPLYDAVEGAQKVVLEANGVGHQVAVVFGQETHGMTNAELMQCHAHIMIASNPAFSVLNIAAAVQIICYEIWKVRAGSTIAYKNSYEVDMEEYSSMASMEGFYKHFESVLQQVGFRTAKSLNGTMVKLRRLFNRSRPSIGEVKILRGILVSIEKKLNFETEKKLVFSKNDDILSEMLGKH